MTAESKGGRDGVGKDRPGGGDGKTVLLVAPATDFDCDLADLFPLVEGHAGAVVTV